MSCTVALRLSAAALGLLVWPAWAAANCEELAQTQIRKLDPPPLTEPFARDPATLAAGMAQLATLSRTAVQESIESLAAEHNRSAAQFDLKQAQAARLPNLTLSGSASAGEYTSIGRRYGFAGTGNASLLLSAPLYDGGRLESLTRYRDQLAGASTSDLGAVRERVVRDALLTVLERNRYRTELQVQQQYVNNLTCLSGMIERIVLADGGRASEQVQARTNLNEAQIRMENTRVSMRLADAKLLRLLGDASAAWSAVVWPLVELPPLDVLLAQVKDNPELRKLEQQAEAQNHLALAAAAERSPQVRWEVGTNGGRRQELNNYNAWRAGVTLNYQLYDFGVQDSAAQAARERAKAARRNWEQGVKERNNLAVVLRDTASSAFDRATRFSAVMRDSNSLRNATYVQWASLGRRSLFDLMAAEGDLNQLQLAYVNAMFEGYSAAVQLRNLSAGLLPWLAPDLSPTNSQP